MRNGLVGLLSATVLASTMLTPACADYSSGAATGGSAPMTGGSSTGGSTGGSSAATGGAGGTTGGAGTGGAGGTTGGAGDAATGGAGGGTGGAATGGAGAAATGGAGTAGGGGIAAGGIAAGGSAGSGAGATSCSDVTPCGGDLVGAWTVTSSCLKMSGDLDMSKAGIGCTAAPIMGSLQVMGTWTADADGMSFSDTTTTSGSAHVIMPASCLEVSGTSTTCDRVGPAVEGLGYTGVTCADNTDLGCDCDASVQQTGGIGLVSGDAALTSATYTTADNVLTTTDGRHTVTYSYCVSGNTLTLTPLGMPTITTGTIVLQKQ